MRPDLAYRDLDDVPLSSLTILTVTRRVVGTPIYLSPEAARGDDPDPLFDLWALAVLLFEAVSGTHPLRVQETAGLRHRILEGDVADIRSVAANCPDPVAKFLAMALARDPSARPRTAAEFRERLSSVKKQLS
jgi:serine/threonine protein kinase